MILSLEVGFKFVKKLKLSWVLCNCHYWDLNLGVYRIVRSGKELMMLNCVFLWKFELIRE